MSWIQSLLDKGVYVSYRKQLTEPDIVLAIGRKEAMAGGEDYILDAEPFVKPIVNRTMVPVRFLSEALGVKVAWLNDKQQVIIEGPELEMVFTIDSDKALVNGEEVTLDCSAENLPPGRTYVPLRFVSENMGVLVEYDHETQQITIRK